MIFRRGKRLAGLDDVTQTNPNTRAVPKFKDYGFSTPPTDFTAMAPPDAGMSTWEKLGLGGLLLAVVGAAFALATGKKKRKK